MLDPKQPQAKEVSRCPQEGVSAGFVRQVVKETGIEATVEHVTDRQAIVAAGVLSTPAVAVDGVVKLSGRIPKAEEVRA
jgi:small redox-active disulfide protein 2